VSAVGADAVLFLDQLVQLVGVDQQVRPHELVVSLHAADVVESGGQVPAHDRGHGPHLQQ